MKKTRKDKHFIKQPYYEGGLEAMRTFVRTHKKYPKTALENKIEGSVRIRYKIDHKGNVIETKVISGLGHGCDEEAARVVKLLKFHVPKNHVNKIHFHKTVNVHFKLPTSKPKPVTTNITYQISAKKPAEHTSKPSSTSSGSYSYTIQF
ncbi:MAG: energy transducer TonB [Bacteroidota bacterium]